MMDFIAKMIHGEKSLTIFANKVSWKVFCKVLNEPRYSIMDQVKFVEDSL